MTLQMFSTYSLSMEILVAVDFFYYFDHLSYSKNCASTIYFVCCMLYYCMYFKLDLSFYMFLIFFNKTDGQSFMKKSNSDKYFDTEGVYKGW
jgi:hypothetical protein